MAKGTQNISDTAVEQMTNMSVFHSSTTMQIFQLYTYSDLTDNAFMNGLRERGKCMKSLEIKVENYLANICTHDFMHLFIRL